MMLWFVLVVTSSYAYEIGPYPSQMACGFVGASVHAGLEVPPRPVLATVMCVPKLVFGVQPHRPEAPAHPSAES